MLPATGAHQSGNTKFSSCISALSKTFACGLFWKCLLIFRKPLHLHLFINSCNIYELDSSTWSGYTINKKKWSACTLQFLLALLLSFKCTSVSFTVGGGGRILLITYLLKSDVLHGVVLSLSSFYLLSP